MARGYLFANITVTDSERYQDYRRQVLPVVEQYGGRFLVRGGAVEKLEGADALDRLVVIEFQSVDAARSFYRSPEYAPLLTLREQATRSQVVIVEGLA
jgi:uncharacterized protein (DUF1330 family)